jgi:hypothetical protein
MLLYPIQHIRLPKVLGSQRATVAKLLDQLLLSCSDSLQQCSIPSPLEEKTVFFKKKREEKNSSNSTDFFWRGHMVPVLQITSSRGG